jgi:hypothetical protein
MELLREENLGIFRVYSVFGIGVDRRNALMCLFHQEKGTLKNAQKVYLYSENAPAFLTASRLQELTCSPISRIREPCNSPSMGRNPLWRAALGPHLENAASTALVTPEEKQRSENRDQRIGSRE